MWVSLAILVVYFSALNKANDHEGLIKNLEQICKELEEKSAHHDQQIADALASTESNTLNISLNMKNMKEGFEDGKLLVLVFGNLICSQPELIPWFNPNNWQKTDNSYCLKEESVFCYV